MSRDPRKLEAFLLADGLVIDVYRATRGFPSEERFALQRQLRRASVSVAVNLVEGSARPSTRDYLHFVAISIASASEVRYIVGLSMRLGFVEESEARTLGHNYTRVIRALQALLTALGSGRGPRPEARGP